MSTHKSLRLGFVCALLAAVSLWVYWPVRHFEFTNYDDPEYVTENQVVQAGLTVAGVRYAFGHHAANWHPVTWLSHMADCNLFGTNPGPHHLVNALLHAVNAMLLFLGLRQLTSSTWRSALVAALFAWHPVHVQSVAWVAERKDVLSAFFGLLSLWAYALYARALAGTIPDPNPAPSRAEDTGPSKSSKRRAGIYYALALISFAFGVMSKPMLVTWPLIFLLLDYWPLARFRPVSSAGWPQGWQVIYRLVREKIPFLAIALADSALTFAAQRAGGSVLSLEHLPLLDRLGNGLIAYWSYLGKLIWPVRLSVFYPLVPISGWQVATALLGLLVLAVVVFLNRSRRPYVLVGVLWYSLMLIPVSGLVQVGGQAMADRYMYLPSIGLFLGGVWAVSQLFALNQNLKRALVAGAAALLVASALGVRYQVGFWRDSATLFRRALEVTPLNALAHYNLGVALVELGDGRGAEQNYRAALEIDPRYGEAHSNLGALLATQKRFDEAQRQLELALECDPRTRTGAQDAVAGLSPKEDFLGAVLKCRSLIRQHPDNPLLAQLLTFVLVRGASLTNSPAPVIEEAVGVLPRANLRAQVAAACLETGRTQTGLRLYREALQLSPDAPDILNNLAWALATCAEPTVGGGAEAVKLAERACRGTGYQRPLFIGTLAAAYAEAGRFGLALSTAARAEALARALGQDEVAARNVLLMKGYQAGKTVREMLQKSPTP